MDNKINNSEIWNDYYKSFQKESMIPGIRYPNEHLIRFINNYKSSNDLKNKKILELGFGTITNMLFLNEQGFEVQGLEVSENAAERAKASLKSLCLEEKIHVNTYKGTNIPLPDNSVDLIVGMECVYYCTDQDLFVSECNRVLKKGGCVFFSYFTPRHGYMNYIDQEPGGIVEFNEKHINPRLRDLKLFLYKNEEQFSDVFSKYFNIQVGYEDFDTLEVFQSWYYLAGQKHDANANKLIFKIAKPYIGEIKNNSYSLPSNYKKLLKENLKNRTDFIDSTPITSVDKYPTEHIIRFLATWKRRRISGYFENYAGNEDLLTGVHNKKTLEVNLLSPVYLEMANEFGYESYGVTVSEEIITRFTKLPKEKTKNIAIKKWDGITFPFEDTYFDVVFSLTEAYCQIDQHNFIKECARITKTKGEVFMYYLSPRHGYHSFMELIQDNIYKCKHAHQNPEINNLNLFYANKEVLHKLWSEYFDVNIKYFEFNDHSIFYSFYILTGIKR